MAENSTYRDYLLDVNNFEMPKIFNDQQAIAALLTRLILLEPGTNPLFPTMGVGLVSRPGMISMRQARSFSRRPASP